MKDRNIPCIYYTCAHEACLKGFKDVTVNKCKNCLKYKPRKTSRRQEPVGRKRQKDHDRHDNWKKFY
jgi:hypothetical protein